MKAFIFIGVFLLAALLPTSSRATTGDEWKAFMRSQIEFSLRSHFTYLTQDFQALGFSIIWKTKQRQLRLKDLYGSMTEKAAELRREGVLNAKLFHEFSFLKKEFDIIAGQAAEDATVLPTMHSYWQDQCFTRRIDNFAKEFDAAAMVDLTKILEDYNDSIKKIIESDDANFAIYISAGGDSYSITDGKPPGSGSDLEAGITGAFTGAFAVVGSLIGPEGTLAGAYIGAAVGAVVGRIVCGVLSGGESPSDKLADKIREEIPGAIQAAESLRGAPMRSIIAHQCSTVFDDPGNREDMRRLAGYEAQLVQEIQEATVRARALTAELEQAVNSEVNLVAEEHIPHFRARFDQAFNSFLGKRKVRSSESKVFIEQKIIPLALKIKAANAAQKDLLWNAIIEGDVRFTKQGGFGFDRVTKKDSDFVFWNGAARAVVNELRTGEAP